MTDVGWEFTATEKTTGLPGRRPRHLDLMRRHTLQGTIPNAGDFAWHKSASLDSTASSSSSLTLTLSQWGYFYQNFCKSLKD